MVKRASNPKKFNEEQFREPLETSEIVLAMLKEYALCDSCLGRQFAMLGHGFTNEERGRALKLACVIEGSKLTNEEDQRGGEILLSLSANGFSKIAGETLETLGLKIERREELCYLCEGAFSQINRLAEDAVRGLSKYEYDSFLVGIKANPSIENREDGLRSKFGIHWGESIRNEYSREIGKRIIEYTKKNVDLKRPDILVVIDPLKGIISLEVNSLFVSGRYRKLARGIPQSRWICSECGGKGCSRCDWKGKLYPDSIEELITTSFLELTKGQRGKLHAAGREDVDVRTLGSGRPFIAEVKQPRLRNINLEEMRRSINFGAEGKIEVSTLKFSSREAVRSLKSGEKATKVYRAIVEFSRELNEDTIPKIEGLSNRLINQLTPQRVAHRRAMKVRKKYLYELTIKKLKPNLVEMLIRCQGGLYVKELINGDEGRTRPSVSEIVDAPAKCVELDVMEVELEESN
ncbi:MAG: tRNA pseudouridine(54/55) synthase Pus10 [Candidatus Bathyarchaeota archaeon]